MSDYPTSECRPCRAPIIWALTRAGKRMPVDVVPVHGGNVALEIGANNTVLAHVVGMAQTFGQARNDLRMAHHATCGRRPPRVPRHRFALDGRIPADFHGRRWCMCGVPGEAGDERHPLDAPPLRPPMPAPAVVQDAARERDAAILGERDDVDDDTLLGLLQVTATQLDLAPQDLADRVVARGTADLRRRDTAS